GAYVENEISIPDDPMGRKKPALKCKEKEEEEEEEGVVGRQDVGTVGLSTYVWKKRRTVVKEKTLEPAKPPSLEEPLDEEKTTSPTPEFLAREEEQRTEEQGSEDMNDLHAYVGERDDNEGEELEVDQEPINIHDSEGEEAKN
ncbi:hypothetical protein KI387_038318, partial [Taxus chinensis]